MESCPLHPQIATNIDKLLQTAVKNETNIVAIHETVTRMDNRINGTIGEMKQHMEESVAYREKTVKHEERIIVIEKFIDNFGRFFWTNLLTLLGMFAAAVVAWMTLSARVDKIAHYSYGYQDMEHGTYNSAGSYNHGEKAK